MTVDYFDQLGAELAELTRQGAHLNGAGGRQRRLARFLRRGAVIAVLAVALAASLVSEFPASASGHVPAAHLVVAHSL